MVKGEIEKNNILIIGGYGLIGSRIAQLLNERNKNFNVFIGSRKFRPSNFNPLILDVTDPDTFYTILQNSIRLIVLCTIDNADNILKFCIENRIDYIDITKPTSDLEKAYSLAKGRIVSSKIVFSSGWMSGIVGSMVLKAKSINDLANEVKVFIYYSINDSAGESSALFMAENVSKLFNVYRENKSIAVRQFICSETHPYSYGIGRKCAYSFDTPDLFILNKIESIPTVEVKTTYSSQFITHLLSVLQRIRLFSILPLSVRKQIFKANGKGDQTSFDVIVTTNRGFQTISVQDSLGQAHLTSTSTVLHIEKMMDSNVLEGIYFSHQLHNPNHFYSLLSSIKGININISSNIK